ncbi:uncharacterized protein [Palaemon carinicauda]|uniref:uncharacterized protein n=1 Tax=Palaemon carinicauda TaxID=392227 RepID=UPI0035B58963
MSDGINSDPPPYYTAPEKTKLDPIDDDLDSDVGVKRLLEKSLIMINKADSCLGYYDVTLRDGSSGTIVRTVPDTLAGIQSDLAKEKSSSILETSPLVLPVLPTPPLPPPISPPPPPPLPPLPPLTPLPPPSIPQMCNENQCKILNDKEEIDKKILNKSNKGSGVVSPSIQRPGGRHHLIDIHGLAIFLRQSTRCLSCKGACCLYVTGAISAQLGAITKVKITCQDCNYTASQSLLRPSQPPEDMATSQIMQSSETPISTPPSETPSPRLLTSPLDLLTPSDPSYLLSKNSKRTGKKTSRKCTKISGKLPKEDSMSQKRSNTSPLPSVPFPLSSSLRLLDNVMAKDLSSLPIKNALYSLPSTLAKDPGKSTELNTSKDDSKAEWVTNDFPWTKKESSPSPESILPDIPCDASVSNFENICGDASCCPNDVETSLCPVTGILSPIITNLAATKKLNSDSFQETPQVNNLVKLEEFPVNVKKDINPKTTNNPIHNSYLAELLQSDKINTQSQIISHCSLSSSQSGTCSSSSSIPIQPPLTSSVENKLPESSLLKFLDSPIMAPSLSFNSNIFPQMTEYNFDKSPLSRESDVTSSLKKKLPENIEQSLQLVRKLIYSVKIPPQHNNPLKTNMKERDARIIDGCDSTSEGNDKIRSLLSFHKSREDNLDLSKFISERYMEYLQEKYTTTSEDDANTNEQNDKDNNKSVKKHSNKTKYPCCCSDTKNICYKKQNLSQIPTENQKEEDSLFISTKTEADRRSQNSKSPTTSLQENSCDRKKCIKDTTLNIKRPKITLKLKKLHFTERGKQKPKHTQRRMRVASVSCHCCYNRGYQKRGLRKRSRRFSQSFIDKETELHSSEAQSSSHSRCKHQENTDNGDVDDILDDYSPSINTLKSEEDASSRRENVEKKKGKSKHIKTCKRRRHDSEGTEQPKKKSWRDIESLEYQAMEMWMNHEELRCKSADKEYRSGDSRQCSPEYAKDSTNRGRFHDLLKSENDSSDSEDDKLTIDLGH